MPAIWRGEGAPEKVQVRRPQPDRLLCYVYLTTAELSLLSSPVFILPLGVRALRLPVTPLSESPSFFLRVCHLVDFPDLCCSGGLGGPSLSGAPPSPHVCIIFAVLSASIHSYSL